MPGDGERGRAESVRGLVAGIVEEFREKQLMVQASAVAFRIVVALIPTALFVIAVLGAIGLDDLWHDEALPEVRENVSGAMAAVISDAVTNVLESNTTYWITAGAVLAALAMASIVDAVTHTLNRIHEVDERRSFGERAVNSVLIGVATGLLLLLAVAIVRLGAPAIEAVLGATLVVEVLGFIVRWATAACLLMLAVALMVRVAPAVERPLRRVTVGAAITVGGWIVASLAFGLYLDQLAVYDSIFGQLATVYIALQYIALSVIVYIGGLVIDARAVRGADGNEGRSR